MGVLYHAIKNPNYRGIDRDFYPRSYRILDNMPEGYCPTCKSFTTNINNQGECSECGTPVREGVEEE